MAQLVFLNVCGVKLLHAAMPVVVTGAWVFRQHLHRVVMRNARVETPTDSMGKEIGMTMGPEQAVMRFTAQTPIQDNANKQC